ncbi:four-helix bundle copper-binding protein [Frankia sp. Cr2]|uniref:four-helix bundle copper-binding protein n=1 Tax=Frankia sp. Cr2 TaxID=3073932 RepID=UPI002AD51E11|nr:four-helix bundle copper-binding protein [Frankia sp. Cr2]
MQHAEMINSETREAIENCMSCSTMCEETIAYCMDMPATMMDATSLRTLMDCAAITRVCADMMCRMSSMQREMCAMCARICTMCAEMAAKLSGDAQMMKLAEACRACAASCQAMAGAAA